MEEKCNLGPRVILPLHWLGRFIFWVIGWKIEGEEPNLAKYVLIVAPHTSNWDLPLCITGSCVIRIRGSWLAKHTVFWWPLGAILRYFGGIPLDRSRPHHIVAQAMEEFTKRDKLILALAPEGTRAKTEYWKSGFYYIAHKANVPLVLCFADYKRKVGGFGPTIHLTGDVDADMAKIRAFYDAVTPKHPELRSPVRLREQIEAEA